MLQRLDQRVVAFGPQALRLKRTVELEDQRSARQRVTYRQMREKEGNRDNRGSDRRTPSRRER